MAWQGMAWQGMTWPDITWPGMEGRRHVMPWHGMACGGGVLDGRAGQVQVGRWHMPWQGMAWCDTAWPGMEGSAG